MIDKGILRAFAIGQLDEATEDGIVALPDQHPELYREVAAVSTNPIVQKLKAHSSIIFVHRARRDRQIRHHGVLPQG